jgi:RimJ/RimL family protein N-acetyltransferase
MHVFLETDRLILRRFTDADVDLLFELDSDLEVMRFVDGGKTTPRDLIQNTILPRFLRYYDLDDKYGFWAVVKKSSGAFLGWFHFRPLADAGPDEVELGYRLRKDAWGQGYGTEGSRALIHRGFTEFGVQRVVASSAADNVASWRVMEKSGLTLVRAYRKVWPGQWDDEEQEDVEYALTRADWERQRTT